jgi:hypothetical protein
LQFWLLCTWLVASQWRAAGRLARVLIGAACLQLALALALTCSGRGFYKSDLNRLTVRDCGELSKAESAQALILPPARLLALAAAQCRLHVPLLGVPSVRIVPSEEQQLSPLRAALAQPGSYWLATIASESSIAVTQMRVEQLLAARCAKEAPPIHFGTIAHPGLRPERPNGYLRFSLQRYRCPQ